MLSLVYWLAKVYSSILESYFMIGSITQPQQRITDMVTNITEKITLKPFYMAVIHIAKQEDPDLLAKIQKKCSDIKNISANSGFNNSCYAKPFDKFLRHIAVNRTSGSMTLINTDPAEDAIEPITYCVQPLISVVLHLEPSKTTQSYVTLLLMLRQLKNYSFSRLYCELIRSSLASLYNVSGVSATNRESMWCAFTFIKVPQILQLLHATTKGKKYT